MKARPLQALFAKRNESRIPHEAALITARFEQLIGDIYAADFESVGELLTIVSLPLRILAVSCDNRLHKI